MGSDDDTADDTDVTFIYFGVYIAIFLGITILSFFGDKCKTIDSLSVRLQAQAYTTYKERIRNGTDDKLKKELDEVEGNRDVESSNSCCNCWENSKESEREKEIEYHAGFKEMFVKHRMYYGLTKSTLVPNSCLDYCVCCFSDKIVDLIFYALNNHSIIAMFGTSSANPFSRGERRMAYFLQHSMAFMFACFLTLVPPEAAFAVNVFVVSPLTLIVNYFFYYLAVCPCLQKHVSWSIIRCCKGCLEQCGSIFASLIAFSGFFLLLIAAFFSVKDSNYSILVRYLYQVAVISQAMELIQMWLKFWRRYIGFYVLGIKVYEIGGWFKEYLRENGLETEITKYQVSVIRIEISGTATKSTQVVPVVENAQGIEVIATSNKAVESNETAPEAAPEAAPANAEAEISLGDAPVVTETQAETMEERNEVAATKAEP